MDRMLDIMVVGLAVLCVYLFLSDIAQADTDTWDIRDGDWYAEIGMGYSTSLFQQTEEYMWESGGSPGFYGAIRYEWMPVQDRLGVVFHYAHYSNWFTGPPFNNNPESSLDHIGVAVRWKLNR